MAQRARIRTEEHDLATYLHRLADRLRRDALAVRGLARQESRPGDPDYDVMDELAAGLEEVADSLGGVKAALCSECRMVNVEEQRYIGSAPVAGRGNRAAW